MVLCDEIIVFKFSEYAPNNVSSGADFSSDLVLSPAIGTGMKTINELQEESCQSCPDGEK